SPAFAYQLKLSLHVAITNSARTNHWHELKRGCAVARLFASDWGRGLAADFPQLRFWHDDAYVALRAPGGGIIDGTGTALRRNDSDPEARLALLAAFCEPPLRTPTLLGTTIAHVAAAAGLGRAAAARAWLERYLALLFGALLGAYERYGLTLEIHQQNLLV